MDFGSIRERKYYKTKKRVYTAGATGTANPECKWGVTQDVGYSDAPASKNCEASLYRTRWHSDNNLKAYYYDFSFEIHWDGTVLWTSKKLSLDPCLFIWQQRRAHKKHGAKFKRYFIVSVASRPSVGWLIGWWSMNCVRSKLCVFLYHMNQNNNNNFWRFMEV